ncbi:outer membrane lipid asymmetry maintenance protein MlaD [Gluconacetobacter azotocaptans]|uniref:Outer membrane lipid asymmetry maintenance protein MlaD n=1 Tax=Gluconacetobacter azotocaptans TaxID=142834 RepID=A0A7W4PG92_9PROT|nr:outer membrane lipid asymmetry maintenance protein MlaD [Gluconacetobacter azotocaptans]MBB2191369.1 outer membrane lipid asymmetry maintenance protein MlaD [Gluconacetobacter azotocaptans]MBM9402514.1 outer membrane lipid asymmetry maintenance protein MlaD [Gluconacetobacter azotocaptans]GBQ26592.1 toluene ABC transporter periplasmic protein [Gluconacetobacter azotocaptans DSM 13594]
MVTAVPVRRGRNPAELAAGCAVLAVLGGLLTYAVIDKGHRHESGYRLAASFAHVDGLSVGSDVRLAGVTVGQVVDEQVDPASFKANVTFTVRPDIRLPTDSAAIITSDSLLGGKYIALSPGGNDAMLHPGATITETQGSISLEQLLSRFIFSVTDSMTRANQQRANQGQGQQGQPPAAPTGGQP